MFLGVVNEIRFKVLIRKMKSHDFLTKVLVSVLFLLLIGVAYLFLASQTLKEKMKNLEQESRILENNFNALKKSYDIITKENQALKNLNAKLKEESISLSASIKDTKLEVEQAIEKLNDFETTVKSSINWFQENTNIENLSDYGKIKNELGKCVKFRSTCDIDLKCIYDVNKRNNIRYRYDEDTTGKNDFLKDLKLIYWQNGGDCEDFSLLYRAEFNFLLDKCLQNYTREQTYSIAVDPKTDKPFKIDEDYMNIICGTFDPKEVIGNVAGHCLNTLTKSPISSSFDIYKEISGSVMVEPQLGEFYGNLNSTGNLQIFDNGYPPNTLYYLYFVITDDDLYIFDPYSEKVEWKGYHNFLEDSQQILKSVKT